MVKSQVAQETHGAPDDPLAQANVSPDLAQAANDIRFLSQRFKGLIAAGDALENLGSIKNAVEETKTRHADLLKKEQEAQARLADIESKVTAKTAEHAALAEKHAALTTDYGRVASMVNALMAKVA